MATHAWLFPDRGIQNDIRILGFRISDWMDEADTIRERIQKLPYGGMKNLHDRLARVVKIMRQGDILTSIWSLESSVTSHASRRGTASDWTCWMDEAETIRKRIQRVLDGAVKNSLNSRLERDVGMIKEDVLNGIRTLEELVTSGNGTTRGNIYKADTIRSRIQGLHDDGMKHDLNDELERVVKRMRQGDVLNCIWSLEDLVTSGRGMTREYISKANTIRSRIQGLYDDGMKHDLNDKLERVAKRKSQRDTLTGIWSLESSVTNRRGTASDWMDEAETIRTRIQRVPDGVVTNSLNSRLERVVEMIIEAIIDDIFTLGSSSTSRRDTASDLMDKADTIRNRIQELRDGGKKDGLNGALVQRVKRMRRGDILTGIWSLESSVSSRRGKASDWKDEAETIRRRIQRVPNGVVKNSLNSRLEHVVEMMTYWDILNGIWSLKDSVNDGRGTVSDWMDKMETIRRGIQGLKDGGAKDRLKPALECVVETIRREVNEKTGSIIEDIRLLQSEVSSMDRTISEWVGKLEGIQKRVHELDPWYQCNMDSFETKRDMESELTLVTELIRERENGKKSIQEAICGFLLDTSSEKNQLSELKDKVVAIRERIGAFKPRGDMEELNNELSTTIRERVNLKDAIKLLAFEVASGHSTISDGIESVGVILKRFQGLDQEQERSKLDNQLSSVIEEIKKQADVRGSVGDIVKLLQFDVTRGNGTINRWKDRAGAVKKIRRLDSWEERSKYDCELAVVTAMIRVRALRSVENATELLLCDVASGSGSLEEWTYRGEAVKEMIRELDVGAKIKGELEEKLSQILMSIHHRDSTIHGMECRQLLVTDILHFLSFLWSLYLWTNGTGCLLGKRSASVWKGMLLRCGDVEPNPGPNQLAIVVILVAGLLLHTKALLGKTECQLKSSSRGSNWLEVHCSATDDSGHGDIICYVDSELQPPLALPVHKNGLVTAAFRAQNPTKINCCSNNGTVVTSDSCLDFVDEHPTVPPSTIAPPFSDTLISASTKSRKSLTTHRNLISSWTSVLQSKFVTPREKETVSPAQWTSGQVVLITCASVAGTVILMTLLIVAFPGRFFSACIKIQTWKANLRKEAREEGEEDVRESTGMV